jgi:hypothetical protein
VRSGGFEVWRSAGPLGLRRHCVTGAALLLLAACGGRAANVTHSDDPEAGRGGTSSAGTGGAGGTSNGDAGAPDQGGTDGGGTAGAGDAGSGAGGTATACAPLSPRLIRLTHEQFVSSVEVLTDAAFADELRAEFQLGTSARTFPPLVSEGNAIGENALAITDAMAQRTASYASDNIEVFSGCTTAGEIACVRDFLPGFAERAFRRPLTDADRQDLTRAADEAELINAAPADVLWAGVYSVLHAPSFLYRTEFGEAATNPGELELTPHEIADALAFFLRDAPPDLDLLQAATDGRLSTTEDMTREVERLLATPAVQTNLRRTVLDYLVGDVIQSVVLVDPAATGSLLGSAAFELDRFVSDHLFSGPLNALLTSRDTRINAELATLYGIPFPPSGATPDADGFAAVTLPESRAGFLSSVGFLLSSSLPDRISAFRRGTRINQTIICGELPPIPVPEQPLIDAKLAAGEALAGSSARDMAEYRITQPACVDCHAQLDSYGIGLEGFDNLARVRAVDEVGAPIRASVTLPSKAGGAVVDGVVEMSAAIAESGAFTNCATRVFLRYALSETRPELDAACEVEQAVERASDAGDPSFSRLVTEIAVSAFRTRQNAPAKRLP